MEIITVPGGRHLSVDYDGEPSGIGDAYEKIIAYAIEHGIVLGKTWFETCLTGALDGDWERHLRCEASARALYCSAGARRLKVDPLPYRSCWPESHLARSTTRTPSKE